MELARLDVAVGSSVPVLRMRFCRSTPGVRMSNGDHRIQIRLDDEGYAKARRAAIANGLRHASALCEMLLEKEYERLGFDKEITPAAEVDEEVEHRMNVRVNDALWVRAQERAASLGLKTVADLGRLLLERDLAAWSRELSEGGTRKRKGKRKPKR